VTFTNLAIVFLLICAGLGLIHGRGDLNTVRLGAALALAMVVIQFYLLLRL